MTGDEAKFILSAFRPNGSDADTPAFGEALRMAASDPMLGAWFARSRSHDAQVASKLAEIAPPARLREAILAGARASQKPRNTVLRYSWVAGLAAAAALALVVATMRAPVRPGAGGALATFAITDVVHGKHGGAGEPTNALISQLQVEGAPMPGADQIDFEKLRQTGCRTLSFAGHDVLEVCFARNGAMFHLYVTRRDPESGEPAAGGPTFIAQAAGAAALWSDTRFDYALASTAGIEAVRRLF